LWPFGRKREVADLGIVDEDGFVDLDLSIARIEREIGALAVTVAARHEGVQLAMRVTVRAEESPGQDLGDGFVVYPAVVTLASTGPASDAFVRVLAEAWGIGDTPSGMVSSLELTALALEGRPDRIRHEPVKLKLFHETNFPEAAGGATDEADENEDQDYFEMYLNIDVTAGRFRLSEKDPDYRQAIIRGLGSHPTTV